MANNEGHTLKVFDADLDQLRAVIAEMGGLAEAAIRDATGALTQRDATRAARVVRDDGRIDQLEQEVERQVVRLIALRAPMADDLREVLAALKIAGVIERMGDYAKTIAKRELLLEDVTKIEPLSILPAMAGVVSDMVREALDAFAARDAGKARAVCLRDPQVDDLYNSMFRALLTHMMENPHTITASTHLLFVAKSLERIGDHATNIAEMVYFAATGEMLGDRPRGRDIAEATTEK
jgi:phosphate transport system protein